MCEATPKGHPASEALCERRHLGAAGTTRAPKVEVPDVFDMPGQILSGMLPFARPVARAIKRVTGAQRVGMSVIGLEVPHAHVHLVPIGLCGVAVSLMNLASDMGWLASGPRAGLHELKLPANEPASPIMLGEAPATARRGKADAAGCLWQGGGGDPANQPVGLMRSHPLWRQASQRVKEHHL